jgi:chromate transporter
LRRSCSSSWPRRTSSDYAARAGLTSALAGVTAAVVGVITNLAVYFAVHTLFGRSHDHRWVLASLELPEVGTIRWVSTAIAAAAAVMIFILRWSVLRTLAVCALVGLACGAADLRV